MKRILVFILGLVISIGAGIFFTHSYERISLAAATRVFVSSQLAESPQSGYILSTDGSNSSWIANSGGPGGTGSNWTIIPGGLRTSTSTDFAQAAYFTATSTTGTSSFAGNVTINGNTRLATSLTGLLKGTSGVVSTASSGSDYEVPLTFGDGLTRTANDVDVDTTQNISTLSNLTSNGFVKTSGGTGALSIDTSTYLTTVDISANTNLTGGLGLTLTGDDMACDTASGSVFGCLSSADWNTFNGKESVLTFSNGLTRTTNNIAPTSGYNIPLTASTTNWNNFFDTPSTRITAGTNLSWSGNTLNASGGGSSNWLFNGSRLTPSTTVGIGVFASSTISNLSMTNATATNVVTSNINGTLYVDGVTYAKTGAGIQQAITFAETSAGGNTTIQLPCGTFALTSALLIQERLTLQGSGRCTNLNVTTAINGITINAAPGAIIGLTIRDLQISGNNAGTYGVYATTTGGFEITGFHMEDVQIDGFDTQFYIDVSMGGLCDNCILEYGHTNSIGVDFQPSGTERIWMHFNRPWFEGLTTGANIIGNSYISMSAPHWSTPLTNRYLMNDSGGNHPELSITGDLGAQFIATGAQNAVMKIHSYNSVDGLGELRFVEGSGTGSSRIGLQFLVSDNSLNVRDFQNSEQRVTFAQAGNVGIASTSPSRLLTVSGDAIFANTHATGTATSSNLAITGLLSQSCIGTNSTGLVIAGVGCSGAQPNWLYNDSRLSPSTTVGIGVFASSTIGGGATSTGLTINGGATTTGQAYFANKVGIGISLPTEILHVVTGTGGEEMALFRNNSDATDLTIDSIAGTAMSIRAGAGDALSLGANATDNYIRILSTGLVGIGTTTPATTLSVVGTSTFTGKIINTGAKTLTTGNALCYLATGEYIFAGGTTCVTSSARWKQDIENLDTETWKELLKLDVKDFNYKPEYADNVRDAGGKRLGVIAEDVEQIDPRLVQYGSDGKPLTVHFDGLITLLIQAVQAQQEQLDTFGGTAKKSAEENYQWIIIALLFGWIVRLEIKTRK